MDDDVKLGLERLRRAREQRAWAAAAEAALELSDALVGTDEPWEASLLYASQAQAFASLAVRGELRRGVKERRS